MIPDEQLFHLARVALAGNQRDAALLVRKYARGYRLTSPELADRLIALLREAPLRGSPTRGAEPAGVPVDTDSKVPLVRIQEVPILEVEPFYEGRTWTALRRIVRERQEADRLAEIGVDPTRTALFTGSPGTGKTLAAKWIARELGWPLVVLDLSAVMSSFLGRTGGNLRAVIDFARERDCVLLLDELDAVAKRRDDASEIGELKRLVTVLLQEIDEWPPAGLLLSATNHPGLLDPAAWRRFEAVVEFPLPGPEGLEAVLRDLLELDTSSQWPGTVARSLDGASFADAARTAVQVRRVAALEGGNVEASLEAALLEIVKSLPGRRRRELAVSLVKNRLVSQRQASAITGVSRDTIRSHTSAFAGGLR